MPEKRMRKGQVPDEFWSAPTGFVEAFAKGNQPGLVEALMGITLALSQATQELGPVEKLTKRERLAYMTGIVMRDLVFVKAMLRVFNTSQAEAPAHSKPSPRVEVYG
jgi:hypothetical protein